MADFRGSVGYLQLKAANQARQQAITDSVTNQVGQDNDIGGKALGVVQDMVGDARKVRDRDAGFANAQRVAQIGADGLANRLMLRSSMPMSEKDQAIVDDYRSKIADRTAKQGFAGRGADRNDARLRMDAAFRDHMAAISAAGADARQVAAAAAAWAAGMDVGDIPGPPVTIAPGAISQAAQLPGGGPSPAASHRDPAIQPSAQPAAPDAAQSPATVAPPLPTLAAPPASVPPPTIGGYNPQPPPPVDTSMYGPRVSKVVRDSISKENAQLQELGPELQALIKTVEEGTLPEDYVGGSASSTAREVAKQFAPDLTKLGLNFLANSGHRDQTTVDRQEAAQSAYGHFQTKYIKSLSGLTVTDVERANINSILGTLNDSLFAGKQKNIVESLRQLYATREQIYKRNNEVLNSGYLPKGFSEVSLGDGRVGLMDGSAPVSAPSAPEAPQTRQPPTKAVSAEQAANTPVGAGDWEQKKAGVIALMRKHKIGQDEATARYFAGER